MSEVVRGGKQPPDRGTEQGDPLGSLQCELGLSLVKARTQERLMEQIYNQTNL